MGSLGKYPKHSKETDIERALCYMHLQPVPPLCSLTTSSLTFRMAHVMSPTISSAPNVPPFHGFVETTVHALRLIYAARQGIIPRITRRLNDAERRTMIRSGSVFVFGVEESGIKRWTDGLLWSPSRIVGNFLVYREINERNSARGSHRKPYPTEEVSMRPSSFEQKSIPFKGLNQIGLPTNEQGTFKPNGLIKKTITVTIDGSDLHLISYYTSDDVRSGRLKRPSSRPDVMALHMPPHIFRLTNFRNPPKIEIGPDGKPRLVCEDSDSESVEFKVEDAGHSPTWNADSASRLSSGEVMPFGNASHPSLLSPNAEHGNFYPGGGRWANQYDSSRGLGAHHGLSRHDGEFGQTSPNQSSSWSSNTRPWLSDSYPLPGSNSELTPERSRPRPHSPFLNPVSISRSRVESQSSFSTSYNHVNDPSSQRLNWMLPSLSESDRLLRHTVGSNNEQYPVSHGYSDLGQPFSSTWSSSSLGSNSPTGFSADSQVAPYDTYTATSSPDEDYATVDKYVKR